MREDYWFGSPPEPDELLLGPIERYLQTLDDWARADQRDKLNGLYVDVDWSTGSPALPPSVPEAEVLAMIALVEQVGWQVRQGDHIVWREFQDSLDAMGEESPFSATAVTGEQQRARIGSPGWEAYRRSLDRLIAGEPQL